jgi:hypothetical protein
MQQAGFAASAGEFFQGREVFEVGEDLCRLARHLCVCCAVGVTWQLACALQATWARLRRAGSILYSVLVELYAHAYSQCTSHGESVP